MEKLLFLVLSCAFCLAQASEFPAFSKPRAITGGPHDHLFASYFGIDSWSPDDRYVTALETDVKNRLPTENDPAKLGLVDMQDGNRWIPLTETRCWNFQEATMAHWLAWAPNKKFIFNDLVNGKFVSVIYNIPTRTRNIVGMPVSAVSPDGHWAVSINYSRLRATRPDYGYGGNGQDARLQTAWPEEDGLFLLNIDSGESKLIVSIASQREKMESVKDPQAISYFCHTKFSRDGKKIFWLARSIIVTNGVPRNPWTTSSLCCDKDGSNVVRCFPDGWGGSHFNWLDGNRMVVTANYLAKGAWSHVFFTVGQKDWRRLGGGLLDFDGHAVFSSDGAWMVSDSYPDRLNERKLYVMRMADEAILPLGTYFVPELYRGTYWRCDLHPRWSEDNKYIGFNSVHEGSRQIYVLERK